MAAAAAMIVVTARAGEAQGGTEAPWGPAAEGTEKKGPGRDAVVGADGIMSSPYSPDSRNR